MSDDKLIHASEPCDDGAILKEKHGWAEALAKGYPKTEPTEGERMAAFFATSEHKRHEDETEPDWAQLDRLLLDEKTIATAYGDVATLSYRQDKGQLETRYVLRTSCGTGVLDTGWTAEAITHWPGAPNWWTHECFMSAAQAQQLIREARPKLPKVAKVASPEFGPDWRGLDILLPSTKEYRPSGDTTVCWVEYRQVCGIVEMRAIDYRNADGAFKWVTPEQFFNDGLPTLKWFIDRVSDAQEAQNLIYNNISNLQVRFVDGDTVLLAFIIKVDGRKHCVWAHHAYDAMTILPQSFRTPGSVTALTWGDSSLVEFVADDGTRSTLAQRMKAICKRGVVASTPA